MNAKGILTSLALRAIAAAGQARLFASRRGGDGSLTALSPRHLYRFRLLLRLVYTGDEIPLVELLPSGPSDTVGAIETKLNSVPAAPGLPTLGGYIRCLVDNAQKNRESASWA